MRLNRFLALLLLLVCTTAGCASSRGVSVGSDTGQYALDVTNTTGTAVDVYWSTGSEPKMLGNVAPGRKEHFIVAGAKSSTVSITAVSAGGKSMGPFPVVLEAGSTKSVTIR